MSGFRLVDMPKPVGFLEIAGGLSLAILKKPRRLHLAAMRVAFGWTWRDA